MSKEEKLMINLQHELPAAENKKTEVRSWILFDFANSVYPAVISSVVFQAFFINTVVGNESGEGDWWWGRAVALSVLLTAITSPILGAIADRCGVRKKFMGFYVALCLIGVTLFPTIEPGMVYWAFALFVLANVGFEGCLPFYNAYLSELVPSGRQGQVSGQGFALGYLGSAFGLGFALLILSFIGNLNLVWLMVSAFFLIFSIPSFLFLPPDDSRGKESIAKGAEWGISNVRTLWKEVMAQKEIRNFLIAYFFYIDGVLTATYMATTLASTTFGYTQNELIYLFLLIQISALAGAFLLAKPTDRLGPKKILNGVLVLWISVALGIYFLPESSKLGFAFLGLIAGVGLGSVQSASRTLMARLTPVGKEGEMFGFYALCGKSSSFVGPLMFGYVAILTGGNQKLSVMSITILFVIGLALLQKVDETPVRERASLS
jgi:UMF1 family MFS transporter|tara:strand:- start:54 stop:1355 length:1302 start_codon:yes stop_codon:yes gene_type:complete